MLRYKGKVTKMIMITPYILLIDRDFQSIFYLDTGEISLQKLLKKPKCINSLYHMHLPVYLLL